VEKVFFLVNSFIYFIILHLFSLYRCQNDGIKPPLHSPLVEPLPLYPPDCAGVFLVGYCVHTLSGCQLRPRHILFIFCHSVQWPKQWANIAPHTFFPSCISSRIPSLPPTLSFGWLLCQIIEQWLPKAWAPPLSLFLKGLRFGASSKGTGRSDPEPATGRLLWTHGESQCQEGICGAKIHVHLTYVEMRLKYHTYC
jgi:hypothetical protein